MNIFRPKLNQINSVVIALLFSCFLYAQKSTTTLKSISGKITYLEAPLPDVNIKIDGTTKGTKTDAQRSYYIEAKVGDVLEYSHVSFKAVAIMIEDVTTTLNIEMTAKTNTLDEVVVKARKKVDKVSHIEAKLNTKFKTSVGTIDPRASGFDIKYIEGKDLNLAAPSLSSALRGKFAGVSASNRIVYIRGLPALWDVDGQIFEIEPPIDISQVVEIYILKQSSVRYGGRSVVVVRTIANTLGNIEEKRKEVAEQYTNQNYYNNDAVAIQNETTFSSNAVATQNTKAIPKNISGKVNYIDTPLVNVNIIIVGKTIGTKTNARGEYNIKATVGDIIQYSHVGFATVSIIIEDVTEVLDIKKGTISENP